MKIPYLSFEGMHAPLKEALQAAFERVLDSGWLVLGPEVEALEAAYAAYCGTKYAVGVGSGLDALIIALRCLGIGPGDEVIVPSNTYIATWLAVKNVGARVVPVEPDPATFNLDPAWIEAAITPATRCILPVHLFGLPCEMGPIMEIAAKHGLKVVEDNAQAQGAAWQGQVTGSFGHANAHSFYPGKNLGALGEAGMLTTNDPEIAKMAKSLRNYGSSKKYVNDYIGYNSRLDELQAALLRVKLPHLAAWNAMRADIASLYTTQLAGVGDLILPTQPQDASSVNHIYCVRTAHRNALQAWLSEQEIGTLIHYPIPPHLQNACSELGFKKGDFPLAEKLASTSLSLPIYPGLSSLQIGQICDSIADFFQRPIK